MNIWPSCMSTMALHHQASASSPAETEPFAGLHSDGISICDVGLGWWAICRKDVHFATVCQVLSIKSEKFCTQMVSRSVMRDYEMISRWAHFAMCKVLSLRTEKFCDLVVQPALWVSVDKIQIWWVISDYWLLILRRGWLVTWSFTQTFCAISLFSI